MADKRESLRKALKARIGEKKIQRSSKQTRDQVLESTLKEAGLDKKKFMEDLEKVRKEQGNSFEMNFKK